MSSCKDCPSYVTDEIEIRNRFKKQVGAPMCGRYGYVLGAPNMMPKGDDLLMAFADECPSFGEPLPASLVVNTPQSRVAEPSVDIISDGPTGESCASCHGCKNAVKHDAIYTAFGWPLPLCKAFGTLIFEPMKQAKGCAYASPGMPEDQLIDVRLRREYQSNFVFSPAKAFAALVENGNLNLEPSTYPTDSPVDAHDAQDGIRAWRKVLDPSGTGKELFLPIFDRAHFTADEQRLIPTTGDAHHPELYVDYANLLWKFSVETWALNETLLLQSEPGLGKTDFTYWLAWLMQVPWRRIAFKGSTEYDEVFGKMGYNPERGTYFEDGRFTMAWRSHACVLCVDEPNLANNAVIESLRTTTDTDQMLYIDGASSTNSDGSTDESLLMVPKGKYVFPVWCMNPSWDIRNIGTKEMANADVDRLSPAIVPYPPENLERHIIRERCKVLDEFEISDKDLDDMMKVAEDIREMARQGTFPGSWGLRQQIKVARKMAWYPFEEAYRMAALNYYEPETAEHVVQTSIATIRG